MTPTRQITYVILLVIGIAFFVGRSFLHVLRPVQPISLLPHKTDEIIFKFQDGLSQKEQEATLAEHELSVVRKFPQINAIHARLKPFSFVAEKLPRLSRDRRFAYIVPNYFCMPLNLATESGLKGDWGVEAAAIQEAWSVTLGDPEIRIAILDSPIDTSHPDLLESRWINPGEDLNHNGRVESTDFNHGDDDENGYVDDVSGWNFMRETSDGLIRYWDEPNQMRSGTMIAGILGATGYHNVYGIARGAKWISLGVFTSYLDQNKMYGTSAAVIEAILYAADSGCQIIIVGWERSGGFSEAEAAAMSYAARSFFVVPLRQTRSPSYPSAYEVSTVITVTSTDPENEHNPKFFNPNAELAAPGMSILSTSPDGGYEMASGAVLAAAYVSGVAALLLSMDKTLPPSKLKSLLIQTSDPIAHGPRCLNAGRAIKGVMSDGRVKK